MSLRRKSTDFGRGLQVQRQTSGEIRLESHDAVLKKLGVGVVIKEKRVGSNRLRHSQLVAIDDKSDNSNKGSLSPSKLPFDQRGTASLTSPSSTLKQTAVSTHLATTIKNDEKDIKRKRRVSSAGEI